MITMAFFTFLKGGSDYFSTSVLARLSPIRYQQLWQVYLIICFLQNSINRLRVRAEIPVWTNRV